jgi:hypothetical protein
LNTSSPEHADQNQEARHANGASAPTPHNDAMPAAGENASKEIARLRAECERLTALVAVLEKDKKVLLEELCHYLPKGVTPEMVAGYMHIMDEPSVPFETVLADLERIDKEFEAADQP